MTPEQILRDLRDIHLPAEAAGGGGSGIVHWPITVVIVALAIGAWFAWRRRSAWRQDAARHLDRIERDARDGRVLEGWSELSVLLRRVALHVSGRREVAGLVGEAWLEKLDRLFDTDLFSAGPGRGIASLPYRRHVPSGDEEEAMRTTLAHTIAGLRRHLHNLGRPI